MSESKLLKDLFSSVFFGHFLGRGGGVCLIQNFLRNLLLKFGHHPLLTALYLEVIYFLDLIDRLTFFK